MSDAFAVALQGRGVRAGDRVAMYLQNIPQVLADRSGGLEMRCGRGSVQSDAAGARTGEDPRRRRLPRSDLSGRPVSDIVRAALSTISVRHTITTSAFDFLSRAPVPGFWRRATARGTLAWRTCGNFSRGTTGSVRRRRRSLATMWRFWCTRRERPASPRRRPTPTETSFSQHRVYEKWIGFTEADSILGLAPLFHVTGLVGHVALAFLTGSPLILFYRFDVEEACRLTPDVSGHVHSVGGHGVHRPPRQQAPWAGMTCRRWSKVYTGGAPTPPGVLAEWHARTGTRISRCTA